MGLQNIYYFQSAMKTRFYHLHLLPSVWWIIISLCIRHDGGNDCDGDVHVDDDIIIVIIMMIRMIIFHRCPSIVALVSEETVARLFHKSWIMDYDNEGNY